MHEQLAQLILTSLVVGFAAILLFIAEVLNRVLKALGEKEYQGVMTILFRNASRSVVLTLTGAVPFLGIVVFAFVYGFDNWVFLLGGLFYMLSVLAANLINGRLYKRVQAANHQSSGEVSAARNALCNANWFRAVLATAGAIVMVISMDMAL